MTAQIMNRRTHPKPDLEVGDWKVIRPPFRPDDAIEVGVLEVHPSFHNRIVYATRTRSEKNHDLEHELVVIQDFDELRPSDNPLSESDESRVVACFSLDELVTCVNDFQHTHSHTKQTLPLLSINAIASWTEPITVHTLGAVQHLSFIDREAIRTTAAPGYVKDRPSTDGIYKLMIGFRRCIVTVTLFKSKSQQEPYARGLSVQAYIGPDDIDDYEGVTKAKRKLPASYAVPISEHIIVFGCYDGGVRFYDLLQRKYVKSALGPNGRSNPVVRVMNANPIIQSGDVTPQTIMPKIVTACASGVAYLWELDLSVDVMTGEIIYFNIPPPVASFDGMVASISGKGVPLIYHPSLSPTSIASLSPCSSWEQLDMVNAQFEISFDPHRNIMFWTFSPDCVGASLLRHASRDDRLNSNGSIVAWDLSTLPDSDWPPPLITPRCVFPLLRTEMGRISPNMVLPGILNNITPDSLISTVYVSSSSEIVTAITDMSTRRDVVQRDSNLMVLADLNELRLGEVFSIAASRMQPSLIAMGTSYGVLLARTFENDDAGSQLPIIDEEASVQFSIADQSVYRQGKFMDASIDCASSSYDMDGWSLAPSLQNIKSLDDSHRVTAVSVMKERLSDLESRNIHLGNELEETLTKSEVSTQISEERERELRAQMASILEQQQQFCDATKHELQCALASIEHLQSALAAKEQSCVDMQKDMDVLRHELENLKQKYEEDEDLIQNTPTQLSDASKMIEILEMRISTKNQLCQTLQEEVNSLKTSNEEEKKANEARVAELVSDLISTERTTITSEEPSELLEQEISELKRNEESLQIYVKLLEEDKALLDKELDEAKQKIDRYEHAHREQQAFISDQKESIDSLVDLLDKRERDHEMKIASLEDKISSLESECEELQQKLSAEEDIATQAEMRRVSMESLNVELRKENIRLEQDALKKHALYTAMKNELQNALNELAVHDNAGQNE